MQEDAARSVEPYEPDISLTENEKTSFRLLCSALLFSYTEIFSRRHRAVREEVQDARERDLPALRRGQGEARPRHQAPDQGLRLPPSVQKMVSETPAHWYRILGLSSGQPLDRARGASCVVLTPSFLVFPSLLQGRQLY